MRVEVNDRDGTVRGMDRAEQRKNNSVIATQCHDSGVVLAIGSNGRQWLTRNRVIAQGRERVTMKEFFMAVFNLTNRILVVVGGDGNVTAIDDFESSQERVDSERNVVAAVQSQPTRPCPDARWSESGARTVGSPGVLESCTISFCSRERYD